MALFLSACKCNSIVYIFPCLDYKVIFLLSECLIVFSLRYKRANKQMGTTVAHRYHNMDVKFLCIFYLNFIHRYCKDRRFAKFMYTESMIAKF